MALAAISSTPPHFLDELAGVLRRGFGDDHVTVTVVQADGSRLGTRIGDRLFDATVGDHEAMASAVEQTAGGAPHTQPLDRGD